MSNHDQIRIELQKWTATGLGRYLIDEEDLQLKTLLPNLYGPIAIQCGALGFTSFLRSSAAIHHVAAVDHPLPVGEFEIRMLSSVAESMPFETRSISVLVLPHVLEFSSDPHQVLRETSRVLVPEGHLVLTGFNPLSLWGIRRTLGRMFDQPNVAPWGGRFYSLSRIKDWISVLGFEAIAGGSACYVPPLQSAKLRNRLGFLQKAGSRWWPLCAAAFILVARKKELGMTPIVPGWKKKKRLNPGLAEPATR